MMGDDKKDIVVMVVDDEPDFRQLMGFWLKSKGYSFLEAPDGPNAIQLVKENPPDIVFMDLNMPVIDGVETIRRIREFNSDIPVIVISAFVTDKNINEAMKLGISGIFYKGKDFSEGLALLESALRTHKKLKK